MTLFGLVDTLARKRVPLVENPTDREGLFSQNFGGDSTTA